MCGIEDKDSIQSIPIMPKEDALDLFYDYQANLTTHERAFQLVRTWYHSSERQALILHKWRSIRLEEEMLKSPDKSEVAVFRAFLAKSVTVQKKFDTKYQGEGYLDGKLFTTVYMPYIQVMLKDWMPKRAQGAIQIIEKLLIDHTRTAGTTSVAMFPLYEENKEV